MENKVDPKVVIERGTDKTLPASEIQVPDLWHIAMWLKDADGNRSAKVKVDRYLDQTLKVYGQQVLDVWHLAHSLKAHIQGGTEWTKVEKLTLTGSPITGIWTERREVYNDKQQ